MFCIRIYLSAHFTYWLFRKKGQATWREYKEVASVCREKIRKGRDQYELSLATVVKDNEKEA